MNCGRNENGVWKKALCAARFGAANKKFAITGNVTGAGARLFYVATISLPSEYIYE
jgi:hypothetical protein